MKIHFGFETSLQNKESFKLRIRSIAGYYDWHVNRFVKLNMQHDTIQLENISFMTSYMLNDPSEFEGGEELKVW